jgi:Hydroxypyruvate isomerase
MIKLSACIEMLFCEHPFGARFSAARACGLDAVEFWGWENKDLESVKTQLEANSLTLAAFCVGSRDGVIAPEWNAKKLSDRSGIPAFVSALRETVPIAHSLGCETLIVTCGQRRDDITHEEQHTNIVLALRAAAPVAEAEGITLVLEPLNVLHDHRGYFLPSSYEAFGIIEEVGSHNVKVLYDVYHQQISEGNLIPTITKNIGLIGHFHTGDVPGRHQPGTGEINYKNVFAAISGTDYKKFVGMEFSPTGTSAEAMAQTAGFLEL